MFGDMLKKQIFVNDKPIRVNGRELAKDIIRLVEKDTSRTDLVRGNPDGTVDLFPSSKLIRMREGDRFETQIKSDNGN